MQLDTQQQITYLSTSHLLQRIQARWQPVSRQRWS